MWTLTLQGHNAAVVNGDVYRNELSLLHDDWAY